jgi:ATP-dependent protease ClpP protease subunit
MPLHQFCAVSEAECLQGMSLVPAVTELMIAELLYLQYDDPKKPISMYINSTGSTVRSLLLLLVLPQQRL